MSWTGRKFWVLTLVATAGVITSLAQRVDAAEMNPAWEPGTTRYDIHASAAGCFDSPCGYADSWSSFNIDAVIVDVELAGESEPLQEKNWSATISQNLFTFGEDEAEGAGMDVSIGGAAGGSARTSRSFRSRYDGAPQSRSGIGPASLPSASSPMFSGNETLRIGDGRPNTLACVKSTDPSGAGDIVRGPCDLTELSVIVALKDVTDDGLGGTSATPRSPSASDSPNALDDNVPDHGVEPAGGDEEVVALLAPGQPAVTAQAQIPQANVPAPSTALLVGFGLAAAAMRRRRRG